MSDARSSCLIAPAPDGDLYVITLDALLSAVHFPPDTAPDDVGWKALAVNLSDLAAMGAQPLSLQARCEAPAGDRQWLRELARALAVAADAFAVTLHLDAATGDSRRISVQAIGCVPRDAALTRAGARAGDALWVSGTLGDAGAGLAIVQGRLPIAAGGARDRLIERLNRPEPRLALGCALRGIASAAIDVSDGVIGDAAHIARRSGVALHIETHRVPISAALGAATDAATARELALHAGDDYELLFCAAPERAGEVLAAARAAGIAVSRIGQARAGHGVTLEDASGRRVPAGHGYQHFAPSAR